MENLIKIMFGFLIVVLCVIIIIYILCSIFLNKFNKLVYGKGTPMSWLPIFNIYLLGKLTINKLVGWILIICIFLTSEITITVNDIEITYVILSGRFGMILSRLTYISIFGLFVYAIVKYVKLKKEIKNKNIQPMEPQQIGQQQMVSQNSQDVNKQ